MALPSYRGQVSIAYESGAIVEKPGVEIDRSNQLQVMTTTGFDQFPLAEAQVLTQNVTTSGEAQINTYSGSQDRFA